MKYGVSKQGLLIIAGCVWIIAGANILYIGLSTGLDKPGYWLPKITEITVIFLLFFTFVFKRLFEKHTKRIEKKGNKSCPFSFFDIKGWLIMCVMITFGIVSRKFHLFPDTFISVFYTGLSLALIITGILFLRHAWKTRQKLVNEADSKNKN